MRGRFAEMSRRSRGLALLALCVAASSLTVISWIVISPALARAPAPPALALPAAPPNVHVLDVDWYRKVELVADRHVLGWLLRRAMVPAPPPPLPDGSPAPSPLLAPKPAPAAPPNPSNAASAPATSSPTSAPARPMQRYRIPVGTYLMATKVVRGLGQPGYYYFGLRDTPFMYSWNRYWPASCVKLMAAVGALVTLRKHGLGARAHLRFEDDDGRYDGPVWRMQRRALRLSTNVDYNRLIEIAGFDALNERYLTARWGLPRMVLQRRYTRPRPTSNLRSSPRIEYREGRRQGVIAARHSDRTYARCPHEANCTTLFELHEVLRRVMLHFELPKSQRFPLRRKDVKRLHEDLLASPHKLGRGVEEALGHTAEVYNKAGMVPGDDHLDNLFIDDTTAKRRYFLALSVPFSGPKEPKEVTHGELAELGRETLRILRRVGGRGPWLQHDSGVAPKLSLGPATLRLPRRRGRRRGRAVIEVEAQLSAQGANRADVWLGRKRLTPGRGMRLPGRLKLTLPVRVEDHALIVIPRRGSRRVGYRFFAISVQP